MTSDSNSSQMSYFQTLNTGINRMPSEDSLNSYESLDSRYLALEISDSVDNNEVKDRDNKLKATVDEILSDQSFEDSIIEKSVNLLSDQSLSLMLSQKSFIENSSYFGLTFDTSEESVESLPIDDIPIIDSNVGTNSQTNDRDDCPQTYHLSLQLMTKDLRSDTLEFSLNSSNEDNVLTQNQESTQPFIKDNIPLILDSKQFWNDFRKSSQLKSHCLLDSNNSSDGIDVETILSVIHQIIKYLEYLFQIKESSVSPQVWDIHKNRIKSIPKWVSISPDLFLSLDMEQYLLELYQELDHLLSTVLEEITKLEITGDDDIVDIISSIISNI